MNPADFKNLDGVLTPRKVKSHRKAMDLDRVPQFYSSLPQTKYGAIVCGLSS